MPIPPSRNTVLVRSVALQKSGQKDSGWINLSAENGPLQGADELVPRGVAEEPNSNFSHQVPQS